MNSFNNPYDAGYDAGMNGANTHNSHFRFFSTTEKMKEWQKGNDDGSKKREAEHQDWLKSRQEQLKAKQP